MVRILFLIIYATAGMAVEEAGNAGKRPIKSNIGSATELRGSTCIYHIFANDTATGWTGPEKDREMNKARKACDYLVRQAKKYNEQISFEHVICKDYNNAGEISPELNSDQNWMISAIITTFDGIGEDMVKALKEKQKTDHVIFMLYVNKNGTSKSFPYHSRIHHHYSAERGVMFANYVLGHETAPASFAHEVLHLFGALDLYFPGDSSDKRRNEAEKLFPDDIMFKVEYNLESLKIDEYTAYLIGWVDALKPEYLGLLKPEDWTLATTAAPTEKKE